MLQVLLVSLRLHSLVYVFECAPDSIDCLCETDRLVKEGTDVVIKFFHQGLEFFECTKLEAAPKLLWGIAPCALDNN